MARRLEPQAGLQFASLISAILPLRLATSLSSTARQPELSDDRFLIMQAVTAGMFGISLLQRRNASPVHICCASALTAVRTVVRRRLKDFVMAGSHWLGVIASPVFDASIMAGSLSSNRDAGH